ncbi:MAG: hypothetical protein WAW41_08960 [Methylobacter sp.]
MGVVRRVALKIIIRQVLSLTLLHRLFNLAQPKINTDNFKITQSVFNRTRIEGFLIPTTFFALLNRGHPSSAPNGLFSKKAPVLGATNGKNTIRA